MRRAMGIAMALAAGWGCTSDGDTNGSGGTTTAPHGGGGRGGGGAGGSGGAGGQLVGGQGGAATGGEGGLAPGGAGGGPGGAGGTAQGGAGGGGPQGCTWSIDKNPCDPGSYCDAPGCGQGTCQPIGMLNDGVRQPVCGCDGVHYWNAATAAAYGMAVKANGMCPAPKSCGGFGNLKCPAPAHFCDYEIASVKECQTTDAMGICWGMPQKCDAIVIGGNKLLCAQPQGACLTECDAIKNGQLYYPDNGCPQ